MRLEDLVWSKGVPTQIGRQYLRRRKGLCGPVVEVRPGGLWSDGGWVGDPNEYEYAPIPPTHLPRVEMADLIPLRRYECVSPDFNCPVVLIWNGSDWLMSNAHPYPQRVSEIYGPLPSREFVAPIEDCIACCEKSIRRAKHRNGKLVEVAGVAPHLVDRWRIAREWKYVPESTQ